MMNETLPGGVYLACGSTDLRKSIDGLAVLVKEGFDLDPFSSCLFDGLPLMQGRAHPEDHI